MALTEQEQHIEHKMKTAFWQQAASLPDLFEQAKPTAKITKAGGEVELFLFNDNGKLATDEEKHRVLELTNAGVELGACAVEVHPGPVDLRTDGFNGWFAQLKKEEKMVVESAKQHGLFVGRSGTIPWIHMSKVLRTDDEKYRQVPDFHDRHRTELSPMRVGPIRLKSAAEVGGINSFQFSIQAEGAADSVDKLNRLFMISPLVSTLSSNSRIIDSRDTGQADTRFEIWRQTHDLRSPKDIKQGKMTRVGLPSDFPSTLHEYFEEVSSYPFILDKPEHALAVGIGLSWRDARIKIMNGKFVVEFRPISTQPTLEEDLALAAFSIGRLHWSQYTDEQLPSMSQLIQNKIASEKFGIHAIIKTVEGESVAVRKVLETEIERAKTGLKQAEILDETAIKGLDILKRRINSGITPDQKLLTLSPSQLIDAVKILI